MTVENERLDPTGQSIVFPEGDGAFPSVLDSLNGSLATIKQWNLKPIVGVYLGGCDYSLLRYIEVGDDTPHVIELSTIERIEVQ